MALNTELKTIETKLTNLKVSLDEKLTAKGATGGANLTESVNAVDTISTGKPEEEKTVQIKQNGQTEVLPTEGNVLTKITIQTGVPQPLLEDNKTQEITENGEVVITPTLGNDAMKKATITVNVAGSGGSSATFADLGYKKGDTIGLGDPTTIQKDIDYGKTIKDVFMVGQEVLKQKYYGNKKLVYFPVVDTSKVTNMEMCFRGCSELTTIPLLNLEKVTDMNNCFTDCTSLTIFANLNTQSLVSMEYCFDGCTSLKTNPIFNTSNVTNMSNCFSNCTSLTTIQNLNTSNVLDISGLFFGCKAITIIKQLDVGAATNMENWTGGCTNISYCLLKNLGKQTQINKFCVGYDFWAAPWGVNTSEIPDATQSLVDTLITYSFDRATAGYEPCTVTLSAESKKVLTEDQKAAITAKGFTIA